MLRCIQIVVWTGICVSMNVAQVVGPPPQVPPGMKAVEGKYHVLIHDLSPDEETEVLIRLQTMVEEYFLRTREFSGRLDRKLPFYLFRDARDYHQQGGLPGSSGVFTGDRLMVIAGPELTRRTWHTIQHEGFHQFAAAVINRNLPIWVNEGLAEYFGEAVYTGDGFISGMIPQDRLKRVQKLIQDNPFQIVDRMMRMTQAEWNSDLNSVNYDMAWAMVTFLAHGDDGKYQQAFGRWMIALNRGRPPELAWRETFGSSDGFEQRFRNWWTDPKRTASVELYAQAATQMLTSYLARSVSQRQSFTELEPFLSAIQTGQVRWHRSDPLPPSLARDCVELTRALVNTGAKITIGNIPSEKNPRQTIPGVWCVLTDGTVITGTYKLRNNRVEWVRTEIKMVKSDRPVRSDK